MHVAVGLCRAGLQAFGKSGTDKTHLLNAIASISFNPVRAGLVERATDRPRSSVHAHLAGCDDTVTTVEPVLSRVGDFAGFLAEDRDDDL